MSEQTNSTNKPKVIGLAVIIIAVIAIGGYVSTNMIDEETNTTAGTTAGMDVAANDAASTQTASGDTTVIATVNDENITKADAEQFINNIPQLQGQPLDAVFPMVQEQLISSAVVGDLAEDAGIENDPMVQERMAMAKKEIIRAVFVEKELDKKITEESLKQSYKDFLEKQPDVEEARARHILVETEDEAKAIIAEINDGADFAKVAQEKSTGPTGANGGDLGYFTAKDMVPEFSKVAFGMEKGEVTDTPVKTQFGYHVIKLEDKRMRPSPTYADVKPYLKAQERKVALNELLEEWKSNADIAVFDIQGNSIEPASGE